MRVLLKLILDCPPDAAWNAIRSPEFFRAVSFPLSTFESLEPGGFPEQWAAGEHPVLAKALGLLPVGEQVIDISFPPEKNGVRRVVDRGHGFPGITKWEHTMAVSAAAGSSSFQRRMAPRHMSPRELPRDRTLYRDQLKFEGSPGLWPLFWAFWQWRAIGLTRLAPAFH